MDLHLVADGAADHGDHTGDPAVLHHLAVDGVVHGDHMEDLADHGVDLHLADGVLLLHPEVAGGIGEGSLLCSIRPQVSLNIASEDQFVL